MPTGVRILSSVLDLGLEGIGRGCLMVRTFILRMHCDYLDFFFEQQDSYNILCAVLEKGQKNISVRAEVRTALILCHAVM